MLADDLEFIGGFRRLRLEGNYDGSQYASEEATTQASSLIRHYCDRCGATYALGGAAQKGTEHNARENVEN